MKMQKILNTSSDQLDSKENLMKELYEENEFLTKLLDSIPAKMYFESSIKAKIIAEKHMLMDKAAEDIKKKSSNHIELSAKGKHKRSRLDPLKQKNISQIQDELSKKKQRKNKKLKNLHVPPNSLTRAANIEELQKRLQEKIDMLQAQRKAVHNDPEMKKKLKTRVKKLKVKQKGNLLKEVNSKPEKPVEESKNDKQVTSSKPVFNKDGNLIYSKFDFSEDGLGETKRNEYTGKKTKALLKKAEKKKEKLANLKDANPEKAQTLEEKEKWKKAIQKSEGLKIKDDVNLLKKSLKKEEKKKNKSAKAWKARNEEVDKRKKAHQEKRTKNIRKKQKEKLDRKIKLAKKKGRVIPGF